MVRPANKEELREISKDIALKNNGFLYLKNNKEEIKERYKKADTGLKTKSSLSLSDIKNGLQNIANEELSELQRLRGDAYFVDPFNQPGGNYIEDELEKLFQSELIVNKKRFARRFDIAPTDADFFIERLEEEGNVKRIPAGERDYFVSGEKHETSSEVGLDEQLKSRANSEGKIDHKELEEIIDVAATTSVIRYLSRNNDYMLDLDGEYLVVEAIPKFAASLAEKIAEEVAEEFKKCDYVIAESEFQQVVENKINERTNVLRQARSKRREIIDDTATELKDRLELQKDEIRGMLWMEGNKVDEQGFEQFVHEQAKIVEQRVSDSAEVLSSQSAQKEAGREHVDELQVGRTEQSQQYIQEEVQERYEELIDEQWNT